LIKKITLLFFIISFQFAILQSQVLRRPVAAVYTSMGAYSLHHNDVFSFTSNTAALSQEKSFTAGVYGERRFLLNELNNYSLVTAMPTQSGNFGIHALYSGFTGYNETRLGLGYARSLGKKIDIGARFNYYGISIAGYGNASAVGFEIGTIWHITDKIHTGLQISNPVGAKFGKDLKEKISSVYSFGIGYDASEKFLVSAEIIKEEDQSVNINTGLQYRIMNQLLVRAGISSATSSVWGGVGLSWGAFRLDVTTSYHPDLGITPGLLILYKLKKKEN